MEHSPKKSTSTEAGSEPPIIEERIVKIGGEISVRKYAKGRFLGKGGFAKCYELKNLETKKVSAAKIIPKTSLAKNRAKQKLMSEIRIHRSVHHPNIVAFEHFFEDSENVYILLEMCQNQTLNEMLRRRKRLTELEVQCYVWQTVEALKYLHSHKIIHREYFVLIFSLKLGNLFLTDKMEEKIGDFGLATKLEFEGDRKRTVCGTPNYIAPEILDGKHGHSFEVDIWSLGVIIYTLLIGRPPFETNDVKTTYKRIRINAYSFPDNVPISAPAKDLITKILNLDPAKRLTLDQILEHPFFRISVAIPKRMPVSTLACPPSAAIVRQFMPGGTPGLIVSEKIKFGETLPTQSKPLFPNKALVPETGSRPKQVEEKKETYPAVDLKNQPARSKGPTVWVKKWVDYTSKYGIGYLLTNEAAGVFFNDSTKIVLDPSKQKFVYIERRANNKADVAVTHSLTDYPKELHKKVTLLQHFRNYLEEGIINNKPPEAPPEADSSPVVYLKKWMRTKHAIMFRLSNKLVQVNFEDDTELLLSSGTREVTYIDKKGEKATYPLATALESTDKDMVKRLKYTKDVLTRMLTTGRRSHAHEKDGFDVEAKV